MNMKRLVLMLWLPAVIACGDKDDGDTASTESGEDGGDEGGDDGGPSGDADQGEALYAISCAGCHAADGTGASGPDLNSVVPGLSEGALKSIILDGVGGMPAISVTDEEATDIAAYVLLTWG